MRRWIFRHAIQKKIKAKKGGDAEGSSHKDKSERKKKRKEKDSKREKEPGMCLYTCAVGLENFHCQWKFPMELI